jgi:succinyl-diaminopimelate desuccinylase
MSADASHFNRVREAVQPSRLVDIARRLVAVPSRTGEAGAAADCLTEILQMEGFTVERPIAGHPAAPAVVARLKSARPGPTLQFNGHLDTVHLPFVAPAIEGDLLTGSGSCDMKGGLAAAVEAILALRDSETLQAGSVLLTAHDLHEAPWGLGQQLENLIREGIAGDGVLIPEPLFAQFPVVGRGAATWRVLLKRSGPPVHEVMRPLGEPSVIAAGAELVHRIGQLQKDLLKRTDPLAGSESVFIGQIHSGEIFNQFPTICRLEGTRRWLPGGSAKEVEASFRALLDDLAAATGVDVELDYVFIRDAFKIDRDQPLVRAFQQAHTSLTGQPLPTGPKPFADDGNTFYAQGNIPAITHGPRSGGQHTLNEWVSITDLQRVACVYAMTAVIYCGGAAENFPPVGSR